ncbi:helix-turn-helix transcriptional regulator [Buttiauxella agrestis]|uniref:helix-turn-helix transcriptional regulator n=1 Tax=Buttiauxella agrestis TaxID=82977 RepID=UPI0039747165
MLLIKISGDNVYFQLGLKCMIENIIGSEWYNFPRVIFTSDLFSNNFPNIIFQDYVVSIRLKFNLIESIKPQHFCAVHVPFFIHSVNENDVLNKLRKILLISCMTYDDFVSDGIYKITGIHRHVQLSVSETTILNLAGKGNNIEDISNILNRSERTIGTHCRNAINKMGLKNKVRFFQYAYYVSNFDLEDAITVCLN